MYEGSFKGAQVLGESDKGNSRMNPRIPPNRRLWMQLLLVALLGASAPTTPCGGERSRFYRVRSDEVSPAGRIISLELTDSQISLTWEPFGGGLYRVQHTYSLGTGVWSDVPGTLWPVSENYWIGNAAPPPAYYVSPTGDDANPGTVDKPWRTIQHGVEIVRPGDILFIRGGVFHERVFSVRGGDPVNGPIVFTSYPGEKAVIDGAGVSSGSTGFTISHSYIKLAGLEIRNWDTGIWIEDCARVEISNCEVHDVWCGIGAADGAHDFELNRVEIHHFTLYGFDASPSGGADCYNGVLNDCVAHTCRDPEQNVDGFALGHGTQHDFVFNRCLTYDVYDGFDISARDTTLNGCSAHDCGNGGYKIWADNVTLVNCLSYHSDGTNLELDWSGLPKTTTAVNCDFVDCRVFNVCVENPADCVRMHNCILAGGDNIGLAIESIASYQGDYNIFHNDNPDRAIVVWNHEPEFSLNSLAAGNWTAFSGQDIHSLVCSTPETELFRDLGNWDFHLREGSIAIDAGTLQNAPAIDYDGVSRPQGKGYDIGAYERDARPVTAK